MPRQPASEKFDEFLGDIEPFIAHPRYVKTGEIWEALKHRYSYSYIGANFKLAMELMTEQGKAKKIRNGTWEILKVNKVA